MTILDEVIEFIQSDSMKEHLKELERRNELSFTDEELISIVYNGDGDINMKEAFLLNYPEMPAAIDMIKRFEAVRRYIEEQHEHEIYVLMINNVMSGVYYRFAQAKMDFDDLRDTVSQNAEIAVEMYDPRESKFRGRIVVDQGFEIKSFDFSLDTIKENDMWNNKDTDRVINMFINIPHPFMEGDIVTMKGSLETYKVVNADLPTPKPDADMDEALYVEDMAIEVIPYDEDNEENNEIIDDGMNEGAEKIFLPLLVVEFAD